MWISFIAKAISSYNGMLILKRLLKTNANLMHYIILCPELRPEELSLTIEFTKALSSSNNLLVLTANAKAYKAFADESLYCRLLAQKQIHNLILLYNSFYTAHNIIIPSINNPEGRSLHKILDINAITLRDIYKYCIFPPLAQSY